MAGRGVDIKLGGPLATSEETETIKNIGIYTPLTKEKQS